MSKKKQKKVYIPSKQEQEEYDAETRGDQQRDDDWCDRGSESGW